MAGAVDYCTGFPEHVAGMDLSVCCAGHDAAFARAGDLLAFLTANLDLGACVSALGHHPILAISVGALMLAGTTLCGLPFWLRARAASTSKPKGSPK